MSHVCGRVSCCVRERSNKRMNQRDPIDRELYQHQLPHHQDQPSNLPSPFDK